jgi:hypothetical protein
MPGALDPERPLELWAFSDAHVGTDLRHGRESLADALRQSEGPDGFAWDIAVNLGDHSGTQGEPDDAEGAEVVRQYAALRTHRREQIYDVGGNHDRSDVGTPEGAWVDRWLDPTGSHPASSGVHADRRPYPVLGTWERYSVEIGNLLLLLMSDRNEPSRHLPRSEVGGNPGGVVSAETFAWWRDQLRSHPEHLVITGHHYVPKDTTVASGEWEGCWRDSDGTVHQPYHGYKPRGTPNGASYLYFVGGAADSGAFEGELAADPGRCALWLGGHTHSYPGDRAGGKRHVETRWGTHVLNVSALTRHHHGAVPMSRVLTFVPGSRQLTVECVLHTDELAPAGFHAPERRVLTLPRPFLRQSPGAP